MKTIKLVPKETEPVTREMIEKKTSELCEMIHAFTGSKADAAAHVCFGVVNWAAYNYYEAIGIMNEVLFTFREVITRVTEEEDGE